MTTDAEKEVRKMVATHGGIPDLISALEKKGVSAEATRAAVRGLVETGTLSFDKGMQLKIANTAK